MLITNFRNTIGDLHPPTYVTWLKDVEKGEDKPDMKQIIIVYWTWILYFLYEFYNLIILLNFLIAIVSDTYARVMQEDIVHQYRSRCALNSDVAVLSDMHHYISSGF